MIVYRLTKEQYKKDISGKGAEKNGGRWNSKGVKVLYTSESRALCIAEVAVHVPLGIVPKDYFLQTIELPNSRVIELRKSDLPKNWKSFPHHPDTNIIGDRFIQNGKCLIMKVFSTVVQGEYNYLINPEHKDFTKVKLKKIEVFEFDKRLFVK